MRRAAGPGSRPGLELESVSLILAQMSESESLRIRRLYILGHGYNSESIRSGFKINPLFQLSWLDLEMSGSDIYRILSDPSPMFTKMLSKNVRIVWASQNSSKFVIFV